MHFLLINYEYPPIGAGAATATEHIAKAMAGMGHAVSVFTSSYKEKRGYGYESGINVYRVPCVRTSSYASNIFEMISFTISAGIFLPKFLSGKKPDIIITFFSFPCGPLGLLGKYPFKTPYIVALRGGDVPGSEPGLKKIHWILTPLRRLVLKQAESVVANSKGLKNLSEKTDSVPVKVIPNGVDTQYFIPGKKHFGDRVRFLYVGRFQAQKNLFFLLDQVKRLKKRAGEAFVLILIGDGPQKRELRQYAIRHGLENQIKWVNWCGKDEIRHYYQTSDWLINPSFSEGMSNVLLEAMACGLPVLASRVPGNEDLVQNETNGLLFDLKSRDSCVTVMQTVLKNPDLSKKMGKSARVFVENHFSWKRAALSYIALCRGAKLQV